LDGDHPPYFLDGSTRSVIRPAAQRHPAAPFSQVEEREELPSMSKLFSRKALIPSLLVAFGLLAFFASPITFATRVLLLLVGLVVPAVVIVLWKDQPPTVAEVLNRVERSSTR